MGADDRQTAGLGAGLPVGRVPRHQRERLRADLRERARLLARGQRLQVDVPRAREPGRHAGAGGQRERPRDARRRQAQGGVPQLERGSAPPVAREAQLQGGARGGRRRLQGGRRARAHRQGHRALTAAGARAQAARAGARQVARI